jgi:hypothetical protein
MTTFKSTSLLPRLGIIAAIAIVAAFATPAAHAQALLTYFNFNDSGVANGQDATAAALASDAPGIQNSTITTNFGTGDVNVAAGSTLNQASGDGTGAGQSLSMADGSNNNGNWIQFSVSTVSFTDLALSFAARSTGTGFTGIELSYSTDGTTFTSFSTYTSPQDSVFHLATFDLSSVTAIDNQSSVTLRLTFSGATTTAGSTNLDNIQVTAVPEPATVLGGLLGLAGLCFHQRRRLRGMLRIA